MILEVKDLCFNYPQASVLKDISFSLNKGEFMGVIGPNGGGKSTLFKCILNLYKPSSGLIKNHARKMSYVPQFAEINKAYATSVMAVVLSGELNAKSLFFTPKASYIKALKALELVGMKDYAKANIHKLSGGQQQRVLIARALISGCDLMLLDEPTASIDAKGQLEIFSLLKRLSDEQELSILCICHDLAVISKFAKRVLHVRNSAHFHTFCKHSVSLTECGLSIKEACCESK